MTTVLHPPPLVPQGSAAWCFAAAEAMVRSFRNLPAVSQYDIARRSTFALASLDPAVQERLQIAQALDLSTDQLENDGANRNSQVVQLVRTQWNAFDNATTGGHFLNVPLTAQAVKTEIDNNRIFVIGNAYHYYVVYGYENDGNTLLLRDPWPEGVGGLTPQMSLANFLQLPGRVAILFG
ncbi:hypothetical protein M2267_002800 [Ensifer sp. KUDG1]|uniref:papain-like cysteine protease family protein n=1 Tax=unclassified Ensifer TaxID=2633371 RepID=UPI0005BE2A4D|nr:papain-like cysteine protease family protein [Ensifer sp. ZNC0028]